MPIRHLSQAVVERPFPLALCAATLLGLMLGCGGPQKPAAQAGAADAGQPAPAEEAAWTLGFDAADFHDVLKPYETILGKPIKVAADAESVAFGQKWTFTAEGKVTRTEARRLLEASLADADLALQESADGFVVAKNVAACP